MRPERPILVLGAGIQGVCVTLALRARGYRVKLFDRMPDLMLRTSLRNEGKIHLGFVYANDPTFNTAALLLRAALNFAPLIDDWLGTPIDWDSISSSPFLYLFMRDSMLSAEALCAHYERIHVYIQDLISAGEPTTYLGTDLRKEPLWRTRSASAHLWFSPDYVTETIETLEVALDRSALRRILKNHLTASSEITANFGHSIECIERTSSGFSLFGTRADGTRWHESSSFVINCLWDGRFELDRQLGLHYERPSVMRLKYRVLAALPPSLRELPSVTMVLGRFGDIVRFPHAPTYFSWYPACLRGWSTSLTPPPEWDTICAGNPPALEAEAVARETLVAFDQIIPNIRHSQVETVDGGIICSWGESDIDDPISTLHRRYEIGFTHHDGYYSVDTGKFTCAPLFAQQLVAHLEQ